ncbi:MAG: hypothetical protein HEQ37_02610 [Acidovorax sp.]|nr:hypothetical protein [Acidovorax sp.]
MQVRNAGTQVAPASVAVLAFQDSNGNSQYDPSSDTVLGQAALTAALGLGPVADLTIDIAGLLPFRDAPIHVVVDPLGALAESDKANNVRSSAQDVLFVPQGGGAFTPKLKWHWDANDSPVPEHQRVLMVPVLGRVLDTNGDGQLNELDAPAIVFTSYALSEGEATIRVVSGPTGKSLLSISDPVLSAIGGLAIADLDGDGQPEIIATTRDYRVVAYRNNGTKWWTSAVAAGTDGYSPWGSPYIGDIDEDGTPEVAYGRLVLNSNGSTKFQPIGANVGSSFQRQGRYSIPVIAKIQGGPGANLLLGGALYASDGRLVWHAPMDGYTAVADFDQSGKPSIAIVSSGQLSMLDADGQVKWTVSLPGGGSGGPPTLGDMDGDGFPDIGVAGASAYSAFRGDGSMLWSRPSQDWSSQITGSTVFDFDGDGVAEVLYADELRLRVFHGPTGAVLWDQSNSSSTTTEYPVVADVDADGHADVVVISNGLDPASGSNAASYGVRVFEDANGGWVPTRSIWNQHAYSITNINDDLSVPRNPEPSWKTHNTFRLNRRMDADPRAIADITASYVRVVDMGAQPGSSITVRVGNAGSYKVPVGTPVAVYNTDPALGQPAAAALVAQGTTQTVLNSGAYEDLALVPALRLSQLSAQGTVWIVVDDDGTGKRTLSDFDRSNNVAPADLGAIASSLQIAVTTDKPTYPETDTAIFTATVQNAGSFARNALVRFTVLDAAGKTVDVLPLGTTANLQPAVSGPVQASWSVASVLAGDYAVRAELVTPQGVVYGSASAPFAVKAGNGSGSAGTSSLNSARVSTDRSRYSPAQTVFLDSRVANLSTNLLQENLRAVTQVIAPGGQVVLTRTENITQASPRSQRKYGYYLKPGTLAPGLLPGAHPAVWCGQLQKQMGRSGAPYRQSKRQGWALGGGVGSKHRSVRGARRSASRRGHYRPAQRHARHRPGGCQHSVAAGHHEQRQHRHHRRHRARARARPHHRYACGYLYPRPGSTCIQAQAPHTAGTGPPPAQQGSTLPVAATVDVAGTEQAVAQTTITLIGPASPTPAQPKPVPLSWQWLLALTLLMPAAAHMLGRAPGSRANANPPQK